MTSSAVHELRFLGAVTEERLRLEAPVSVSLARVDADEGEVVVWYWDIGPPLPHPHRPM